MVGRKSDNIEDFPISADEPVYTSGVVCRLTGIPIWVLKQLDKEGIVSPPRKNDACARLYSKHQLNAVKHCWFYVKEHNVKVSSLHIILKLESGVKK